VKRVLLALIPVAFLATASLAISGYNAQPFPVASPFVDDEATASPPRVPTVTVTEKTVVAQSPTQSSDSDADQVAQADDPLREEPLPEFVVDKTQLNQAMADLFRAIEQAKLAVTALDADSQNRYIQETINYLAGASQPEFRLVAQSGPADGYKGVAPLLVEARVVREATEVQWIAAVQRQLEARVKKLAEIAQADSTTSVVPQPATSNEIASTVGPTGVLGTRGVRVEEQAHELVSRAIKQAMSARGSDDPTQTMEAVVRILETAQKIVKIAVER